MAPAFSRVCFYHYQNDAEDQMERVLYALRKNPNNRSPTLPIRIEDSDSPLDLGLISSKLWKPGCELRIGFLSGTDWQRSQVKNYAMQWTLYANIQFTFLADVESVTPDVLISFDASKGNWSYLGTDCGFRSGQGKPSMNLAWIIDRRPQAELRADILHQFGHVLGRLHEDENPKALFAWNTEQIYRDLEGPPTFWDRSQVDRRYFAKYSLKAVQGTNFDPLSIMRLYCPSTWTMNGERAIFNLDLSECDKEYIRHWYPSKGRFPGYFNTIETNSWAAKDAVWTHNEERMTIMTFGQTKLRYPKTFLLHNWVSFEPHSRLRFNTNIVEQNGKKDTASIRLWSESPMYSADMILSELESRFPCIQHGVFDTGSLRGPGRLITITFSTPFSEPPIVKCFIVRSWDSDRRSRVYPVNVTATTLTVNTDGWLETGAVVIWVAKPDDKQLDAFIEIGYWPMKRFEHPFQRGEDNSLEVGFRNKNFPKVPRVLLGLNILYSTREKCFNPRARVSTVTTTGFTCYIDTLGDPEWYKPDMFYLAWVE